MDTFCLTLQDIFLYNVLYIDVYELPIIFLHKVQRGGGDLKWAAIRPILGGLRMYMMGSSMDMSL